MAKKDAKASTPKNQSGSSTLAERAQKAEQVLKTDTEAKPSKQEIRVMDVIKTVGTENYRKAADAAEKAIAGALDNENEISRLQSLIQVKQAGNTDIIRSLAMECVTLTAKGKTVKLKLAADLFRVVCEQAELRAQDAFFKRYPERKGEPFAKVVPSWYTIKSDFARGMENGLNPGKHKDGSAFRKAWQEYKKDHPEAVGNRGSAQQAVSQEQAPSRALTGAASTAAKELSANMKAALTTLMTVVVGVDAEDEARAIELLNACSSEIRELTVARAELNDDKEHVQSRRAPAPARESERAVGGVDA
jgi:hypothetical protein